MKKKLIAIISILLVVIIYVFKTKDDTNFVLNGYINKEYDNQNIMLFTFRNDTVLSVDTTIIKNGKFRFVGKEYLHEESLIVTGNYPNKVTASYVILEKGNIELNFINSDFGLFESKGTYLNDEMKAYSDFTESVTKEMNKIRDDINKNLITLEEGRSLAKTLYSIKDSVVTDLILKNKENLVGALILSDNLRDLGIDNVKSIYDQASEYLKNYPSIIEFIQKKEHQRKVYDQGEKNVGTLIINYEFESTDGNKDIFEYVGKSKLLIIDFWASWCGPCIVEFSYLRELYQKYNELELSILSISLDEEKNDWDIGLRKHNLPWNNLLIKNEEGEAQKIMEIYNFLAIPHLIILDEKGEIVAVNLRQEKLMLFVEDYLKK